MNTEPRDGRMTPETQGAKNPAARGSCGPAFSKSKSPSYRAWNSPNPHLPIRLVREDGGAEGGLIYWGDRGIKP